MPELQRLILNKPEPSTKMVTSLSKIVPARLLRFQLQRPVSMDMLSATLLQLIFSLLKSLKILCPLRTIAMFPM
uniref:Uncharacterized protein n=1 Tax=Medicago truncatula TaxID=3880 RepID=I3SEI7_MEDTR|nr:unknown [Medicago truncatula]